MAEIGLDAGSGQDGVLVESFWESFRLDPRQAGHASMRASDADRELVRAVLADAYGDGRLTREEYDDRLNTLYGSLTLGELPSLVAGLMPSGHPPAVPAPPRPADLRVRGAQVAQGRGGVGRGLPGPQRDLHGDLDRGRRRRLVLAGVPHAVPRAQPGQDRRAARIGDRARGCPAGEAGGQGRAPGLP